MYSMHNRKDTNMKTQYGKAPVRSFGGALVLCLMLAGCATTGVNRGDFNLVSLEEEWQLGQQLEAEIARQMKLVNDPTALNYINQLGQRIVAQTEMANLPWKFHI